MNIKTTLKTSVAAAALVAVGVPVAHAGAVNNGNDVGVTMSGHMNYGYLWMDNGSASRGAIVGNNNSRSRIRWDARGNLNEAVSFRGYFEAGNQSNSSSGVSPIDTNAITAANAKFSSTSAADTSGGGDQVFDQRHTYLSITHKQFGTLTIGHTSDAADGVPDNNLGGYGDAITPGVNMLVGSGINVQTSNAADGTFSTNEVSSFLTTNREVGTRTDTLRYNTPSFAGFGVALSTQSDQTNTVGITYGGKFGGIEVSAAAGYKNFSAASTTSDDAYGGSIALLHDSGLNGSFAYAKNSSKSGSGNKNESAWAADIGYKASLISAGSTNFGLHYVSTSDAGGTDGHSLTLWAVGVEQTTSAGINFYASAQVVSPDDKSTNYEDVTTFLVGTKVFF